MGVDRLWCFKFCSTNLRAKKTLTMISLRYTRNLFLRAFCVVYLSAFLSFYIQIPGLYGDNGVLPAKAVLENSKHKTLSAKVHYQPTLLWLAPYLGLDTSYALDVLALLGAFLAFTGMISQKFCTVPLFAGLWSLYFSLFQIGQVFVSSSNDEFLLEAGFLAILVAPLLPGRKKSSKGSPVDTITFWLVKWLLFRFLITNTLTKYINECPIAWELKAYQYYFQTLPLPTPLAWYFHHIPQRFLQYLQVFTTMSDVFLSFFFILPHRTARLTSFVFQIFIQILTVLTGNFDFSNMLIVTLLLASLDDQFFYGRKKNESKWDYLCRYLTPVIFLGLVLLTFSLFKLTGNPQTNFTLIDFWNFLIYDLTYVIYIALVILVGTIVHALYNVLFDNQVSGSKVLGFISIMFYGSVAVLLFSASTVPLASLYPKTNTTVAPPVRTVYNRLHKLHAINQYGLFKRVEGPTRYEILLEGSDNIDGPWKEYNFLYKPGNLNHSLPFVAPYAPKLDWQMYWAAHSRDKDEPWLLSLIHRLLVGRSEVLALLDKLHSPFVQRPPKYIRAVLYQYQYTSWDKRYESSWWVRKYNKEYFPAYSKDTPSLVDFLKARNLLPTVSRQTVNPIWKQALDSIRYVTNHLEATLLFWSVFTAGLAIICTSGSGKK